MSIKEIAIGNYLLRDDGKIGKVTGIQSFVGDDRRKTFVFQTNLTDTYYFIDEYWPIPLTAELLEKFGFKPIYEDKTAWKLKIENDNYYVVSICVDLSRPSSSYAINGEKGKDYQGDILYVHQLQNIITLCEFDGVEINLDI